MPKAQSVPDEQNFRFIEEDAAADILGELLTLVNSSPDLFDIQFLNFYKEVPVMSPADILYGSDGLLLCRTSDAQLRVIQLSGFTIIRSPALRHAVYAAAAHKPETDEVELSGFAYVDVLPDRRTSIRVKMNTQFSVLIEAGKSRLNGRMRVLSLYGCAIDITDRQLLASFSFFYLNMELPFSTFKGKNSTRVLAKLIRVEDHERFSQCIFIFEHDNTTEDQIGRLLTQRQTEIIRELK